MRTKAIAVLTVVVLAGICLPAIADPLPGEILKFQQLPMDGTIIPSSDGTITRYYGHDELSSAFLNSATGGYQGTFMADDFADKFATPVVHVTWWGSYPGSTNPVGVKQFAIVFESDVPADATNNFSHPGTVLLAQKVVSGLVTPGSGTFTETLVSGGGAPLNEALYKYNAELKVPFQQKPDTVYWLKIVALIDDPANESRWGWHNRDYTVKDSLASAVPVPGERDEQPLIDPTYPASVWHFQDDAVTGQVWLHLGPDGINVDQTQYKPVNYLDETDGPGNIPGTIGGNIGQFSKDLAFELYTVPEPATLALLALGGLAVMRRRRKQ
jgi:hypothetical protein